MDNKKRLIIIIIIIFAIFAGVIFFFKNSAKNKAITSINTVISNYDKSAKVTYKDLKIRGLFKPKEIICHDLYIAAKKYTIKIETLSAQIISKDKYQLTLHDVNYEKGGIGYNQTVFSYGVTVKDPIKISNTETKNNITYTAIIPQVFKFNTPYNSSIIKYNKAETPITIVYSTKGVLQKLQYEDQGIKIYNQSDLTPDEKKLISTTGKNKLTISNEQQEKQEKLKLYLKSNDNKIINKTGNSSIVKNSLFGILLDAEYNNDKTQATSFQKTLTISKFNIDFPNMNMSLTGKLIQNVQNLVPFGNLSLSFFNYKEFINLFYNGLATESLPDNTPKLLKDAQKDTQLKATKTLIFLERLNNSNSNLLEIDIDRISEGFPIINNLSFEEVSKIYHQIYGTDKNASEEGPEDQDMSDPQQDQENQEEDIPDFR